MHRFSATVVAAVALAGSLALADNSGMGNPAIGKPVFVSDQERIQGAWFVINGEFDGKALQEGPLRDDKINSKITFKGDKLIDHSDRLRDGWFFTLYPNKELPALDYWLPDKSGNRQEIWHALYQLKDDTLWLCLPAYPNDKAPDQFTSHRTRVIFILKREKKVLQ
jgi:uncharacterized protein (TIGR03067 family)